MAALYERGARDVSGISPEALGAAYLAGMQVGFYPSMDEFAKSWQSENQFNSIINDDQREKKLAGWKDAVERTLSNK